MFKKCSNKLILHNSGVSCKVVKINNFATFREETIQISVILQQKLWNCTIYSSCLFAIWHHLSH